MNKFKRAISTLMVGCMAVSTLAMGARAVGNSTAAPQAGVAIIGEAQATLSDSQLSVMPRALLMNWDIDSGNDSSAQTPPFNLVPGNGTYVRYYFRNDSAEAVHVFLYDVGKGEIVSAMSPSVPANSSREVVFNARSDSALNNFIIKVESTQGGTIRGLARAAQYISA